MSNNYTIPQPSVTLLRSVFNLENVRITNAINPYIGNAQLADYTRDKEIAISELGTKVMSDLTLIGTTYTDNITRQKITLPNDRYRQGGANATVTNTDNNSGFYMNLQTVIFTVDQPIRVVKTEIQGRDGTVKEYIGKDDMSITINGVITGRNGVHPREEVNRLKRWLDAPVSKEVVSWWLENLGVTMLTITDYSFGQVAGGYSYQPFTIQAISDTPVELKIIQPITS